MFSYPSITYNINDPDPLPTITGLLGGTFSTSSGLSIDASTGVIYLTNSSAGNYVITYSVGNCGYYKSTFNIEVTSTDTEIPSTPLNLLANNVTANSVHLSWDAATDNIGVATYDIYRDDILLINTSATFYQALGLFSDTIYSFTVKARDAVDNESLESNEVAILTLETVLSYCSSNGNNVDDEYIGRVQLNTIDNASNGEFYSDFTSISTMLTKGTQYTITVTPVWPDRIFDDAYSVWIDYNKDGDFGDPGEQVWTQSPTQNSPVSGSFIIPNSANSGDTRMRVSLKYNDIPNECETFALGEVEDYTVNLVASNDLIYSNGIWTPFAPSSSTQTNNALVLDGNYNITSDVLINNISVNTNATMVVAKNGSLIANGNLISNDNVTLESDSNEYASLIVDGFVVGNVVYKRHINSATGGNDLIVPPVFG